MSESKVAFKDLLSNTTSIERPVKIGEKEIHVKQYLPVNDKLELISRVVSALSGNPYSFVNPIQLDVYTTVEIIKAYTDIEFPEDSAVWDLYDALEIESLADKIIAVIPKTEFDFIQSGVEETITAYYNYRNSILGILETVTQDYSNLNLEASEIQSKIADKDNLVLLKDIMTKMV